MPIELITIINWGKSSAPMVIERGVTTLCLEIPDRPTAWHQNALNYATRLRAAPPNLQSGPMTVHLGFYGYLRVCNSLCLAKSGVTIFDLTDATWRDWYDDRKLPQEAVDQALADNDFTAGAEK